MDDDFLELMKKGRLLPSKDHVHFDEIEDVLASIDLMARVAPLVRKKPSYWKWLIVSTHNALQGAMVCMLADTTGTSVLTEKSAKAMLNYLQADEGKRGDYPKERLAEFGVLLERCLAGSQNRAPLVLADGQHTDIKKLHEEFRNNFAHFTPKGWSIEKAGLPRIIGAAADAVAGLMARDEVTYRLSSNKLRRIKSGLKATKDALGI